MPIIQSAKKRVKTANKAAVRNSKTKRTLRESLKAFAKSLEGGKAEENRQDRARRYERHRSSC